MSFQFQVFLLHKYATYARIIPATHSSTDTLEEGKQEQPEQKSPAKERKVNEQHPSPHSRESGEFSW